MVSVAPHLRYLIFYVTSRCNLRCDHCFYVDELRACDELTLTEIRRVARSVCPLEFVRITGGEPFLRSDLPLVVEAFVRESGVRRIGIITNGTLPDLTASTVEEILLRCPSVELDVGVSVDGLRETHDRLRNRSGVFDQCRATVRHLLRLRALLAGLRVSVVVTVSSANVRELDELYDDVLKKYPVDPDRVYLTGQSMGGFGSWMWAAEHPSRFAAVAPVCGGGDPREAEYLRDVPIWNFHGAKDPAVPIRLSDEMIEALRKVQGRARYTVYPDAGHGIWDTVYTTDEFYAWLLQQVRQQPAQPQGIEKK